MFCFNQTTRNTLLKLKQEVCAEALLEESDVFPVLSFNNSMAMLRNMTEPASDKQTIRRESLLQTLRIALDRDFFAESVAADSDDRDGRRHTLFFAWLSDQTLRSMERGDIFGEFAVCIVQLEHNEQAISSYIVEVDYFNAADHLITLQQSKDTKIPVPVGLFMQRTKAMLRAVLKGPVWIKEPTDAWIPLWRQFGLLESDEICQFEQVSRVNRTLADSTPNQAFYTALRRFLTENLLYPDASVAAALVNRDAVNK